MTSSLQYWLWGRLLRLLSRVPVRKHWRQDNVARYGRFLKHLYLQCHHCLHWPSLWSLPIIVINVCQCKSMQKSFASLLKDVLNNMKNPTSSKYNFLLSRLWQTIHKEGEYGQLYWYIHFTPAHFQLSYMIWIDQ